MTTDPLIELGRTYIRGSFERAIRQVAIPSRTALDTIQVLLVIARDLRDLRKRALGGPPGVGEDAYPPEITFSQIEEEEI